MEDHPMMTVLEKAVKHGIIKIEDIEKAIRATGSDRETKLEELGALIVKELPGGDRKPSDEELEALGLEIAKMANEGSDSSGDESEALGADIARRANGK